MGAASLKTKKGEGGEKERKKRREEGEPPFTPTSCTSITLDERERRKSGLGADHVKKRGEGEAISRSLSTIHLSPPDQTRKDEERGSPKKKGIMRRLPQERQGREIKRKKEKGKARTAAPFFLLLHSLLYGAKRRGREKELVTSIMKGGKKKGKGRKRERGNSPDSNFSSFFLLRLRE